MPAANNARYANVRVASIHESLGASDQMTESAVPAARTANASSAPPPYSGASRVHGRWMMAATTSAAPASIAAMRTLVVRSRRSPPAAANEAMAIASAMPAASTPLSAMRGSGTVTVRRCGRLAGPTRDDTSDDGEPAELWREDGDGPGGDQDQEDEQGGRNLIARVSGSDRAAGDVDRLRTVGRSLFERLPVGVGRGRQRRPAGVASDPARRTDAAAACSAPEAAGATRHRRRRRPSHRLPRAPAARGQGRRGSRCTGRRRPGCSSARRGSRGPCSRR